MTCLIGSIWMRSGFSSPKRRRDISPSPEGENPKHCIKHKSHITKVMFLCAIVHPRFNPSANSWWDGKLGIWPIGDWEPAKHKSKNRPRGTLVWKNKAVTKEVYSNRNMSKSKGWTLQSSLLTLWMDENLNQQSNKNC